MNTTASVHGGFLRGAATLFSGTVLAQAIAFVASVVLASFYDERAFGTYGAFASALALLGIISTGSYDKAMMFAGSRRRFHALVVIVMTLAASVSAVVAIGGTLAVLVGIIPVGPLASIMQMWLLALATMGFACSQVYVYAALREGRNARIAGAKVAQSALTASTQFAVGGSGWVAGLTLGHAVGTALFIPASWGIVRRAAAGMTRWTRLAAWSSLRKFSSYPRYVCLNEVIDSSSHQLPLLLIGALFSLGTLGHYVFASRMLAAPSALVGMAVSQVFLQRIGNAAVDERRIAPLMYRIWGTLLLLGIVPFGLTFLLGESIFVFVFGSQWAEAGRIAAASSPLLLARFVSSPTSPIVYRLNLQRQQFYLGLMGVAVRATPVLLSLVGYDILSVIAVQTLGELVVIVVFNTGALRALRRRVLQGQSELVQG